MRDYAVERITKGSLVNYGSWRYVAVNRSGGALGIVKFVFCIRNCANVIEQNTDTEHGG